MHEAGQVLREAQQFLGCSKEGLQAVSGPSLSAAAALSGPRQEEETNLTVEISLEGMYKLYPNFT